LEYATAKDAHTHFFEAFIMSMTASMNLPQKNSIALLFKNKKPGVSYSSPWPVKPKPRKGSKKSPSEN
jgi:hypothetical protein